MRVGPQTLINISKFLLVIDSGVERKWEVSRARKYSRQVEPSTKRPHLQVCPDLRQRRDLVAPVRANERQPALFEQR